MSKLYFNLARSHNNFQKQSQSDNISTTQNLDDIASPLNRKSYGRPQRDKDQTNSVNNNSRSINKQKSICRQSNAQAMTDTNSSFSIPINKNQYKYNFILPAQLHDNVELQCPNCRLNNNKICKTCQGEKKLGKDNSLVKFFEYLLQFKLRKIQSYQEQEIDRPIEQYDNTQNIRTTTRGNRTYTPELKAIQNYQTHYGYFCNSCNDGRPIRGPRHKCQICQDFDLCDPCFKHWGHKHIMIELQKSPSYKFSEHVLNKMYSQQRKLKDRDDMKMSLVGKRISALEKKIFSSSI